MPSKLLLFNELGDCSLRSQEMIPPESTRFSHADVAGKSSKPQTAAPDVGEPDVHRRHAVARIDPTSLRLFVAVLEEGTIAGAAKREHVVPAAVSKRIAKLEEALNTRLLNRTNKGPQPTQAGTELLKLARRLLVDLDEIYVQLHEHASGVRGHVRLWANTSAISRSLPAQIKSFLTSYPKIQIDVEERNSSEIAQAVTETRAHIGILSTGTPYGDDLEKFAYDSHELVVIVPRGHALSSLQTISFAQTLDFEYVGLESESALGLLLHKAAADLGRTLRLRIQVTAYEALCRMVQADLGIGIAPRPAVQPYVENRQLQAVSLVEPWAIRELQICVRSFERLPPAARLLVEHLRAR